MTTLYLDRPNLTLRHEPGALVLFDNGVRVRSLPLGLLERVVVTGDVALGTGLLAQLAERDIGVLVLGRRNAASRAALLGRPHNDVRLRMAQFAAYQHASLRLELARELVGTKLFAQARLLDRLQAARPDQRHALTGGLRVMEPLHRSVAAAMSVESLIGIEGAAARSYFPALASVFPPSLEFGSRNRRPPRDPVNACLSLGYTLLHADAARAAWAAGLEPLLGFLHEPEFGRESLAADLIEPLRPHVDEWAWGMFRDRRLRGEHFVRQGEACLLSKTGRGHFFPAWEIHARGLRRLLRHAVRALLRDIGARAQP